MEGSGARGVDERDEVGAGSGWAGAEKGSGCREKSGLGETREESDVFEVGVNGRVFNARTMRLGLGGSYGVWGRWCHGVISWLLHLGGVEPGL